MHTYSVFLFLMNWLFISFAFCCGVSCLHIATQSFVTDRLYLTSNLRGETSDWQHHDGHDPWVGGSSWVHIIQLSFIDSVAAFCSVTADSVYRQLRVICLVDNWCNPIFGVGMFPDLSSLCLSLIAISYSTFVWVVSKMSVTKSIIVVFMYFCLTGLMEPTLASASQIIE